MGIGISIFLIAAGAVLTWGVDVVTDNVNLDAIGIILMVVGALGLLASMTIFASWGDRRGGSDVTIVDR
jgi:hypothetical protein